MVLVSLRKCCALIAVNIWVTCREIREKEGWIHKRALFNCWTFHLKFPSMYVFKVNRIVHIALGGIFKRRVNKSILLFILLRKEE